MSYYDCLRNSFHTKIACPGQSIHRKISAKSYVNLRNFHLRENAHKPLYYARILKELNSKNADNCRNMLMKALSLVIYNVNLPEYNDTNQ